MSDALQQSSGANRWQVHCSLDVVESSANAPVGSSQAHMAMPSAFGFSPGDGNTWNCHSLLESQSGLCSLELPGCTVHKALTQSHCTSPICTAGFTTFPLFGCSCSQVSNFLWFNQDLANQCTVGVEVLGRQHLCKEVGGLLFGADGDYSNQFVLLLVPHLMEVGADMAGPGGADRIFGDGYGSLVVTEHRSWFLGRLVKFLIEGSQKENLFDSQCQGHILRFCGRAGNTLLFLGSPLYSPSGG